MAKRKDRTFDGTLSSLSEPARILYFVIRYATNHTRHICNYHDKTLMGMSGLSRDSYYYAKRELKKHGIIDYDNHPGIEKQEIYYLKDVEITCTNFLQVKIDNIETYESYQNFLQDYQNFLQESQNFLQPSQNILLESDIKTLEKDNKDKPLYNSPKSPSIPSSLNISIISSKGDFSRNSEEEKRIRVINEAMDYIKRLNQETDINRKALYIKRLPDYLNRVPEKDRKSLSEMIR